MKATAATTIAAPIETVWEVVSDPERALRFMSGVTRWEIEGSAPGAAGSTSTSNGQAEKPADQPQTGDGA